MGASDHPQVRIPAPFVYAGFLLAAALLHLALPLASPFVGVTRGLGVAAVLGGLILGLLAVLSMRRAHTSVSPHRASTAVVTDGPYRYTRNPIYLGFLLIYLGFTFLAGTLWGLILCPLVPIIVNRLIIGPEERYLRAKFEREYEAYASHVRRWI